MDIKKSKMGNKEFEILSEDGGLKDILQLLKEQSKKMERLGMALKIIQDGMRQYTPTTVKTSVGEAADVLCSLFNTHECQMKSGVKIQKRLESHPTPTGKMPVGDAAPRDTWPRVVRRHQGACHA